MKMGFAQATHSRFCIAQIVTQMWGQFMICFDSSLVNH